jgi:hypothetical protein
MRNIDPQILRDDWYISLGREARLFWLSLILAADDQGRFSANAALLRSQIFPADDISLEAVNDLVEQVGSKLWLYTVAGVTYGQIVNWWKYQRRAAWMAPSRYPPPEGWTDRYRYHGPKRELFKSDSWDDAGSGGFAVLAERRGHSPPGALPSALPGELARLYVEQEDEDEVKEEEEEEREGK